MSPFHVIDVDVARRNQVTRSVLSVGHHAEVYDSLKEFIAHSPTTGIVLAAQDLRDSLRDALLDGIFARPFALYGAQPKLEDVVSAIRFGALDFVVWPQADGGLTFELERLSAKAADCEMTLLEIQAARKRVATLTSRERDVLRMLTKGNSNKQIAEELAISARTIEIHRANALRKMNAQSSADAVRIAICAGLDPSLRVLW